MGDPLDVVAKSFVQEVMDIAVDEEVADNAKAALEAIEDGLVRVRSSESLKRRYRSRAHESQRLIMEIRSMIDRYLSEVDCG